MQFGINQKGAKTVFDMDVSTGIIRLETYSNWPATIQQNYSFWFPYQGSINEVPYSIYDANNNLLNICRAAFKPQNSTTKLPEVFEEDKIYFLKAETGNSFKVYETLESAIAGTNHITWTQAQKKNQWKIVFIDLIYNLGVCREVAANNLNEIQCCPELRELKTEDLPNQVTVSGFEGTPITMLKSPSGFFEKNGTYQELLGYYANNQNFPLYKKITFKVTTNNSAFYYSDVALYISYEMPIGNGLSFQRYTAWYTNNPNSEEIQIADLENVTLYKMSSSPEINFPETMTASFTGQSHLPDEARLYMPDAFLAWDYAIGTDIMSGRVEYIGDINEVLNLNKADSTYYGSVQNYYQVPGRIAIGVLHYPRVYTNHKFVRNSGYGTALNYSSSYLSSWHEIDPSFYYFIGKRNPEDYPLFTSPFLSQTTEYNDGTFTVHTGDQPDGYGDIAQGVHWFDSRIKQNKKNAKFAKLTEMSVGYATWTNGILGGISGAVFVIGSRHPGCFFSSLEV